MRLICLLLFGVLMQVSASSYSQTKKISVSGKDLTIEEVLAIVEDQSEFSFFYNASQLNSAKKFDLDVKDQTVDNLLDLILKDSELTYSINNRLVIIHRANDTKLVEALAQQQSVSGTVTDEEGQPLPGVTIVVKGTTQGTITNADGEYSLSGLPEDATLQFSFVGMATQEIEVGNQSAIDVTMVVDAIGIEEVVAVGYGTMKKSDLTGAVVSVKSDELAKNESTSFSQMLSGKASGVFVQQNDAQPGGGVTLRVRGSASVGAPGNEPLYIVDGFPIYGAVDPGSGIRYSKGSRSPFNSINPNDIESIEILKDASSTAIYGARAANGVIIITTKSGKEGKLTIDYDIKRTVQKISKPREMLNATEYMTYRNVYYKEKWLLDNKIAPYGMTDPSGVDPFEPIYSQQQIQNAGEGTNWLEEVTQIGKVTDQNLTMTGGHNDLNYLLSANYFDQIGIVKNSGFERFTVRLNLDQKIGKRLKVGIRATESNIKIDNTALSSGGTQNIGILSSAYSFAPNYDIRDENGNYTLIANSSNVPNPVSFLDISSISETQRLLAVGYLEAIILEGLTLNTKVGIDKQNAKASSYLPKSQLYGSQLGGQANINNNERNDLLFNTTLSYAKNLKENHKINTLVGYEFQEFNGEGFSAGNNNFKTDAFSHHNLSAGESEQPTVSSYKTKDLLASYFARVNYNFQDKYLLTASFRADGSTKFGSGNKWGYFPSVSIGWMIGKENYFKEIDWLTNLKLRASAGQTGNSNIGGAYSYYGFNSDYVFGNRINSGATITSYPNPNLKWQTTTEYNMGLDFGFLNNRIRGAFEIFNSEIDGLLSVRMLPSYHQLDFVNANVGKTQSKGMEFNVSTENIVGTFSWSTSVNFSFYRDKWLERNPLVVLKAYQKEDDPIHAIFGYRTDGLIQPGEEIPHMPGALPGWEKIMDIDGFDQDGNKTGQPDGKLDDADVVMLHNNEPDFYFGFNNHFEYKNFDLDIDMYGIIGLYNSTLPN